jgi:hypothetical protein
MQFYSDLSFFQYSKFLGSCDFISFDEKNFYISQFIYAQTKTHVELRFVWFVNESDFWGPKSSFIWIYPSSKIPNSSDVVILFRLMKKTVISANLFTPEKKTHVQLRFVLFVSESDFWGTKSSFIQIYPSSNIPNSSNLVILFRLMKKTVISANLFTPEQKLTFNCVLCDSLVNRILREQRAVLFGSIHLPIFQILRTL